MYPYEPVFTFCCNLCGLFCLFFLITLVRTVLLHMPPIRFHCVGGCWDRRTYNSCNVLHRQSDVLTTRLDLIHNARSSNSSTAVCTIVCLFFRCLINVTCATNSLPSRRGLDYTAGPTQVHYDVFLAYFRKKIFCQSLLIKFFLCLVLEQ